MVSALRWAAGLVIYAAGCASLVGQEAGAVRLFDGRSLAGWESPELELWRVEDGAITCGDGESPIPRNTFLCTQRVFADFELRLKFRLRGDPSTGMINSGVQVRSERLPNGDVRGYQADLGDPSWWGAIYDEHRRNRVLAPGGAAVAAAVRRGEWNDYVIRCVGERITLAINGVAGADYVEADDQIARSGVVGLQLHSGGAAMVQFKDLVLTPVASIESPRTPVQQLASFRVPDGFSVELVASEETGLAKPITVTFDDSGRMWAITATEYPVDANENADRARALWETGGGDEVLVFDHPEAAGPHRGRAFVSGLAMPMGVLPWQGGALVGHGAEIRHYHDRDGDGVADTHDVLLRGFGVQDSHLMPHQFTLGPGGWVYMAQGAFNRSDVLAGGEAPVEFDYCKLGRFRLDGSRFEIAGYGLNNIWGLVLGRRGEMFIQEANDNRYSVVPFDVGASYPGIGNQRFAPYAPLVPAVCDFTVGGTGLSGLARSEDLAGGFPAPWTDAMFIANPITGTVNAARVERGDDGAYRVTRIADFVTSEDDWFRPIAMTFGPDGCLYIVDWYNKIISHNEVRRDHPDRDKTRGRVWRVRHRSQERRAVPDVAAMTVPALIEELSSPHTWNQRSAWRQLLTRGDESAVAPLRTLARSRATRSDVRIHALWCLEGLSRSEPALLHELLADPDEMIRREAARAASSFRSAPEELVSGLALVLDDPDGRVRAAAIRSLAAHPERDEAITRLLVQFARPAIETGPPADVPWGGRHGTPVSAGAVYDREFERYLVRSALATRPELTARVLRAAARDLPAEHRVWAAMAIPAGGPRDVFVEAWSELQREASTEELLVLVEGAADPQLGRALAESLGRGDRAARVLDQLVGLRDRLDAGDPGTGRLLASLCEGLAADAEGDRLRLRVADAFRTVAMVPAVRDVLERESQDVGQRAAALRLLGELGAGADPVIARWVDHDERAVRMAALTAVVAGDSERGGAVLADAWQSLARSERDELIEDLGASMAGARQVVGACAAGIIDVAAIPAIVLERMRVLLPDDDRMTELWERAASSFPRVLQLDGDPASSVGTNLTLRGPFTVECWVRLAPGISNADGVLGRPGGADFNFHDRRFRVYGGPGIGDLVIAETPVTAEVWTHVCATRDEDDHFRVYVNGELDAEGSRTSDATFDGLDIGATSPSDHGAELELAEMRVWSRARTAEEIRSGFDREIAPSPPALVHRFASTAWGELRGGAAIVPVAEGPRILGASAAEEQARKLAHYLAIAERGGDAVPGEEVFRTRCLVCHTVGSDGVGAAPPLDGSGHRDPARLLLSMINPDAAFEAGYRVFRVETHDGRLAEGFLVSQDDAGVTLRFMGGMTQRFDRHEIRRARFLNRSFMTPGLLDSMSEDQVADLIAYVRSLR